MAGYSRQDTNNNIATGNVINAEDFDNEYNALEAAFNESTGHSHDGSAGEGAPIEKVGPSQDLVVTATKVEPKNTNVLDLGSDGVRFKSGYFDGTLDTDTLVVNEASTFTGDVTAVANVSIGGNLSVTGNATIAGNLTFGDAATDTVTFSADINSSLLPDGTTYDLGSATKQWRDLYIDGTANIDSLVADTADINGGTIDNVTIGGGTAGAITGTTITATTGFTGTLTGTASSIANHTTDVLTEGSTNLYFTNSRAQNAISVTDAGGDGSLTKSGGVITYTGPSATETRAHFSAANSGTGYGSLSYSAGQYTFTKVTDSDIRGRFSGGTGISISSTGVISGKDADTTNKGIASFATDDFSVTTGAVSLKAERVQDIVGAMVTGNTETGLSVTYDDADGTLDFVLTADPVITLTGDVTGSGTMTNLGSVSIATTVAANSVALGTDTTGNYVAGVTGGTGVSVTGSGSEGAAVSVAIGQAVGTTNDVTFNSVTTTGGVTIGGNLTVSGTTTTVNSTQVNIGDNIIVLNADETGVPSQSAGIEIERGTSLNKQLLWDEGNDRWTVGDETFVASTFIGNLTGDASGNAGTATKLATARTFSLTGDVAATGVTFDGSGNLQLDTVIQPNSVALGTDTTGNYVGSLVAGTGVSITNNSGEGATPTVAIGQDVSTASDVAFNDVTVSGDLTVAGPTTTINSTTVEISGLNVTVASGATTGAQANGGGLTVGGANATLTYDSATDRWDMNKPLEVANVYASLTGNVTGNVTGNLTGNVTGDVTGNLTGDVSKTGDFTLDSSGDIILDADGGDFILQDNGVTQGRISIVNTTNTPDTVAFYAGTTERLRINPTQTTSVGNFDAQGNISATGNITAVGNVTAVANATALGDLTVGNDIIMTAGASDWKVEVGASNELNIYYGVTKLFKLDSSGNLTVAGNVTAYGTV